MEPKTELQKNAIVDVRKKELETYQRALDIQWLNNRMEDGRMGRCLALIQKETEMEKDFQERTDHASIVNAKAQKETALGTEIAKNTREETNELLRRHYLRERDPQLRELIRKLQAGYVRRDLQQQILHNEYKRLQEKTEEANANRILNHALYDDKESKDKEDRNKMERSRQYSLELQQQLVNRQQQKHCEYEDTLIEKKMLDDIERTMADEDQRELKHKQEQTEAMRQEMVTFQKAREAWKEKQKQLVIMEERKIEEQMKAASDRSLAIVQEREQRLRLKEEANQKIATKILADKAAREERENIIKQLQEQEYIEKNIQDDESEMRVKTRRARESRSVLMAQVETRRREADVQRERENSFRKHVEEKLAAEDEKEKEKEILRREQARKYSEELKKQIRENERRRREEREREERRADDVRAAQAAWDAEVSAESLQIVGEHAGHLRGYLQPGALPPGALPPGALPPGALPPGALPPGAHGRGPSVPARHAKCNEQCRALRE